MDPDAESRRELTFPHPEQVGNIKTIPPFDASQCRVVDAQHPLGQLLLLHLASATYQVVSNSGTLSDDHNIRPFKKKKSLPFNDSPPVWQARLPKREYGTLDKKRELCDIRSTSVNLDEGKAVKTGKRTSVNTRDG